MTWLGVHTILTDETIHPATLGAALEERGFAGLFLGEHSHIPVARETPNPRGGDLPRMYYRALDPFVSLGLVAATTTSLRLGTGVCVLPQRDPIQAAKEVATLDWASGGRVIFGVGVGWLREEIRDHGTAPSRRGAVLDEQLAAMRAVWTCEQAEFHGRYVDFDPIFAWPKPTQHPYPPVYVGGGAAALERAQRDGFGWMPSGAAGVEAITVAMGGAPHTPVIVNAVAPQRDVLLAYREAGATGITVHLPQLAEDDALRALDTFAALGDLVSA